MDATKITNAITGAISLFVNNNWGLFTSVFAAFLAYKALKVSINFILALIFIGIVVSIMTNMGYLPPTETIIAAIKEFLLLD